MGKPRERDYVSINQSHQLLPGKEFPLASQRSINRHTELRETSINTASALCESSMMASSPSTVTCLYRQTHQAGILQLLLPAILRSYGAPYHYLLQRYYLSSIENQQWSGILLRETHILLSYCFLLFSSILSAKSLSTSASCCFSASSSNSSLLSWVSSSMSAACNSSDRSKNGFKRFT